MNEEYYSDNEFISLKSIKGSKWLFDIKKGKFFCNDNEYNAAEDKNCCCYNNLIENIHCEDIFKVNKFFNNIKQECPNEICFNEVIFRFRNKNNEIISVLARGSTSEKDSNLVEGCFFNISDAIKENINEEVRMKNREGIINSIKGIYIIINKESNNINLYGNNKDLLGIDNIYVNMNFGEFKKYIHQSYIEQVEQLINNDYKSSNKYIEIKITNSNGEEKWISLKGEYKNDLSGSLIEFEGVINDITKEKEANIKLKYISDYDELTGIHNRVYLKKNIQKHITTHTYTKSRGALIIIDLDNFKFINDSYGHRCGDLFIKKVAEELQHISGKKDLICRFGGDEFLIFIPNITGLIDVEILTNKIIHRFKETFNIKEHQIYSTASIGVAIFPDDGVDFEELLKNADAAMYIAKINGKNQYQFFNYNIHNEINKRYVIQEGLRSALDKKEMFVVFQPKIKLNNNKTDGFEALLRWKSEDLGIISPTEFIPIAEMNRLIIPIGDFVLEEVFSKVKYLLEKGYDNFKIAINLSEVQLRDRTIISTFKYLIRKYDISLKYIEIEITESILMKSFDKNIETLLELKALGGSIALDDFGTGYSSLNYLTKLPIDVLKIDRSFVIDMIDNHKSRYIVENIIQLSHKLGIIVVAEGVEDLEQVDYLKSIYCDIVQGYYYSKPEVFEDVVNMLSK